MKRTTTLHCNANKKIMIFLLFYVFFFFNTFSQSSIVTIGETASITQNFNTLDPAGPPEDWQNNLTLPGWYAWTDATSNIANYRSNTGANTNAGLYSFGGNGLVDRALGFVPNLDFTGESGTKKGYLGWRLKNNTTKDIGAIRVVWTGEQWRKNVEANKQYIRLSYLIADAELTNTYEGEYILTPSSFENPVSNSSAALTLDGNAAANRVESITMNLNIFIPIGSEIMLRWEDLHDPVNHTIAIDDVSFTATKAGQKITFPSFPAKTFGDADFELGATASSGLPITYTSSDPTVATIDGSTVTMLSSGVTTITAIQAGNDTYAAVEEVRVLDVAPQVPSAIAATSVSPGGFVANWTTSAGASAYYIYLSETETFDTFEVLSPGNVTSFTYNNLQASTTYYYKVRAFHSGLYSVYSNVISVRTLDAFQTYDIVATPYVTTANISWSNGNFPYRIVFLKEGEGEAPIPWDYYKYDAQSDWSQRWDDMDGGSSGYYPIYYGTGNSLDITNLSPNTLYTVRAYEFKGEAWAEIYLTDINGENNPITFTTGEFVTSQDGLWDPNEKWERASPSYVSSEQVTILHKIQIPEGSDPIQVGKIRIAPTASLENNTTFTVTDEIVFEVNKTNAAQFLNKGNVIIDPNAKVIVRRTFKKTDGWVFISFPFEVPLANMKLAGTNTQATWGDAYNAADIKDIYVREYDAQERDALGNGVTQNSVYWKNTTTKVFAKNKGYIVAVDKDIVIDFISSPVDNDPFSNTGTVGVNKFTTNTAVNNSSWNLLGQPFFSAFDLASASQEHAPFYYFNGFTYVAVMPWDSYVILPYSAFFVQAYGASNSMSYDGTGRALRNVRNVLPFDEVDLYVKNNAIVEHEDRARIRLNDEYSVNYELGKDAVKMMSSNMLVPQIFSKIKDLSNVTNSFQCNAIPTSVTEVDLVVTTGQNGTYTIELKNKQNLPNYTSVLLIRGNEQTDLMQESYQFTATQGTKTVTNNWKIRMVKALPTQIVQANDNPIVVSTINNDVYISGLESNATVSVLDLTGKLIQVIDNVQNDIPIQLQGNGLYVLYISNESQQANAKVLIK